jgi:DNA-binding NarL/FixJ family response regulator
VTVKILIADDQALVRQGFTALLDAQEDLEVVGEAPDGREAVAACARLRPDLVLMDVRMPRLNGLEATRELLGASTANTHRPRVLVLTTFDLDEYVYEALRAGASGFLLKDATASDLVTAVRVVAAGEALLAPTATRRLIDAFARQPRLDRRHAERLAGLTARELDVLRLVARGQSNSEVGAGLFIAEQTVKTHVGNILRKLGLRDRAQAIVTAYEAGLVTPGG